MLGFERENEVIERMKKAEDRKEREALSEEEKKEIIQEAKQIVDLKELVTSILMVSDLSRVKE